MPPPRRTGSIFLIGLVIAAATAHYHLKCKAKSESSIVGIHDRMKLAWMPGYFSLEKQPTGPDSGFRATTLADLGILHRSYATDREFDPKCQRSQWERFDNYLRQLNLAEIGTRYMLLFVARHGEGVHNVKEEEVGRQEWERHWSRLEGDGTLSWVDASLTERGIEQAEQLQNMWKDAVSKQKIPMPQSYYTSPLTRCLETAQHTFAHISKERFRPVVKESLREIYGVHLCDRRSSLSHIKSRFLAFQFEPTFSEDDLLWQADRRETFKEATARLSSSLEDLFRNDDSTYVSVTTHSGAIRALEAAVGHPDVWVAAGSVVPILVRADAGSGQRIAVSA